MGFKSFAGPASYDSWVGQCGSKGERAPLDVVLLTHPRDEADLPRLFPWADSLSTENRRILTRCLKPIFGEIVCCERLSAGILFLPMFAQDIIEPRSRKRCRSVLCEEGLAAAAEAGAKQLCLGGLTGALSLYGRLLEGPAANHGITITTGHSTTAVSVLKSYLRAIADLNLRPSSGRMAVLGLGSIGSSFMNLLLHCQPDTLPSRIVVVERPNREKYVQGLMANYRERTDIPIDLELTGPDGRLAPGTVCYDSTFVVSAVSTPYVIDIDQVAPGTVLIDDSQPYCWSRGDAWRRCSGQLDIVPCDAGLVHCGNIGYLSTFPFGFADANGEGQKIAWSCMAEGLLRLVAPELPATVGEPDDKSLQLYAAAFDGCGFSIPPLQCDGKLLPIEELRECFAQTQTTCAGEC